MDTVNGLLSEVEGKSIKASKDCSAVESQMQDVQVQYSIDYNRSKYSILY